MKRLRVHQGVLALILACLVLTFFVPSGGRAAEWQETWNKWLAGAKKEGKLMIYTSMGPATQKVFSEIIKNKFGVTTEFVSAKTAALTTRVVSERNAGMYLVDVLIGGSDGVMPVLKPIRALDALDTALILPEVLNKDVWYGNDLLWYDKERGGVCFSIKPQTPIVVNTDLVKAGEIKSYKDLLNPKWKGKIIQDDPTSGGVASSWPFTMAKHTMNIEYLREFIRLQMPTIGMNRRLSVEWVARGKYAIGVALSPTLSYEFIQAKAPLQFLDMAEGTYVTTGGGCVYMANRAPHPNAAKVFINWLMGKEGQTLYSEAYGGQSARNDVPTDHLPPEAVRKAGVNYFVKQGEETTLQEREFRAKTIPALYKTLMK